MIPLLWLLLAQAAAPPNFTIGPDDVLDIQVFQAADLNRTVRVDQKGSITLPLVGVVEVKGLTPASLEHHLAKILGEKYLNNPVVSVFVREFKSNPVSVIGAVKMPGVYQISSPRPLAEIIAMAQGLAEGAAGHTILVTHDGQTQSVDVLGLLRDDPKTSDIRVHPGDQVRVQPADVVYVMGDVEKPGSFALERHQPVNVVQALAMAGGAKRTAKMKELVIFRKDATGAKQEIALQLTGKLTGPDSDRMLEANDILFVPGSVAKRAFSRALDVGLATASGVVIWRR